jgi:hypothetical protein
VGYSYQFRPELIALDRDDSIRLRPLVRWIARQLLTARLHHRAWPLVALHGLGSLALLLACLVVVATLVLQGQPLAAGVLGASLVLYELGCVALLLWIGRVAASGLEPLGGGFGSNESPKGLARRVAKGFEDVWCLLRWLPLAQLVYGMATVRAALAWRVEWRGVVYRVRRGGVVLVSGPSR